MENVGFYSTLTRASNVSLSDSSSVLLFLLFCSLSREGDDGYMANLLRSSYRCESERSIIVRNLDMREGVDKEKKKKARQRFRLIYSINLNFS